MPLDATVPDPLHTAQAEQLFSLKEWMVAISGKLDRLEAKLDTKADIQHVQQIDIRLGGLEREIIEGRTRAEYMIPQHVRMLEDVGILKQKSAAISSVDTYRRWVWGTAFVGVLSIVLSAASLIRY